MFTSLFLKRNMGIRKTVDADNTKNVTGGHDPQEDGMRLKSLYLK